MPPKKSKKPRTAASKKKSAARSAAAKARPKDPVTGRFLPKDCVPDPHCPDGFHPVSFDDEFTVHYGGSGTARIPTTASGMYETLDGLEEYKRKGRKLAMLAQARAKKNVDDAIRARDDLIRGLQQKDEQRQMYAIKVARNIEAMRTQVESNKVKLERAAEVALERANERIAAARARQQRVCADARVYVDPAEVYCNDNYAGPGFDDGVGRGNYDGPAATGVTQADAAAFADEISI